MIFFISDKLMLVDSGIGLGTAQNVTHPQSAFKAARRYVKMRFQKTAKAKLKRYS
jgi:hypothetical protein